MFQTFRNAWKIPELKNRLLFTLAILVVYRLGSAIPVPFITGSALNQMFSNGNMLSYLDMMSGGALSRCTLFALGVTPYINASIIVQLLTVAIPALENMAKEADGQQKMQQITRYVGGVIALVMSLGYYFVIRNMGALKYTSGAAGIFTAVVIIATFTAGAQLITWCGEHGNGRRIQAEAGNPMAFKGHDILIALLKTDEGNILSRRHPMVPDSFQHACCQGVVACYDGRRRFFKPNHLECIADARLCLPAVLYEILIPPRQPVRCQAVPETADAFLCNPMPLCAHQECNPAVAVFYQIPCSLIQGFVVPVHDAVQGCILFKVPVYEHHRLLYLLQPRQFL